VIYSKKKKNRVRIDGLDTMEFDLNEQAGLARRM